MQLVHTGPEGGQYLKLVHTGPRSSVLATSAHWAAKEFNNCNHCTFGQRDQYLELVHYGPRSSILVLVHTGPGRSILATSAHIGPACSERINTSKI